MCNTVSAIFFCFSNWITHLRIFALNILPTLYLISFYRLLTANIKTILAMFLLQWYQSDSQNTPERERERVFNWTWKRDRTWEKESERRAKLKYFSLYVVDNTFVCSVLVVCATNHWYSKRCMICIANFAALSAFNLLQFDINRR